MFTPFILVCHMMSQQCVTLQDVRGPYETEEQCVKRVDEMAEGIQESLPFQRVMKFKCVKEGIKT